MPSNPAGDAIRAACGDLSRSQVARLLAARGVVVTRGTVDHWINGRRPIPLYAVGPLADVLEMTDEARGVVRAAALAHAQKVPASRGAA